MTTKRSKIWCSAINCYNCPKKTPHCSFFRFPKDKERCARWVQLTRRHDLRKKSSDYLYKNCRICSEHFQPSQILIGTGRLVWNAVPTIFDIPNPPKLIPPKRKLPNRQSNCNTTKRCKTAYKQIKTTVDVHHNYANVEIPVKSVVNSKENIQNVEPDSQTDQSNLLHNEPACKEVSNTIDVHHSYANVGTPVSSLVKSKDHVQNVEPDPQTDQSTLVHYEPAYKEVTNTVDVHHSYTNVDTPVNSLVKNIGHVQIVESDPQTDQFTPVHYEPAYRGIQYTVEVYHSYSNMDIPIMNLDKSKDHVELDPQIDQPNPLHNIQVIRTPIPAIPDEGPQIRTPVSDTLADETHQIRTLVSDTPADVRPQVSRKKSSRSSDRVTIYRLKAKIKTLQASLKKSKNSGSIKNLIKQAGKYLNENALNFFASQLRMGKRHLKGRRYTNDDKRMAFDLYQKSPTAYKFFREMFALPTEKSLKRWAGKKVETESGFNESCEVLKKQAETIG